MSVLDPKSWTRSRHNRSVSESQLETLGVVLAEWAEVHPRRDRPLMALLDDHELTPMEIAEALRDRQSPMHDAVARVFSAGMSGFVEGDEASFEQTLTVLRRETESFRRQSDLLRG